MKNLFLFAAPFFGGSLFSSQVVYLAFPAFAAFSFCASAVYVFNDIVDRQNDRVHPLKKMRPIAAGEIKISNAIALSIMLFGVSLMIALKLSHLFALLIILYVFIQLGYSFWFKSLELLDIFCIASGFIIRIIAGGIVFGVAVSDWLLATMFMVSLLLASGKRYGELVVIDENIDSCANEKQKYTHDRLNEIMIITATSALISYALYTVESHKNLIFTIPFVIYGILEYMKMAKEGNGDPVRAVLSSKKLQLVVVLWILFIGALRYMGAE